MAEKNVVVVEYKDGFANVIIGNRKITVARRDADTREDLCPVELISAALGSWITLTVSAVAEHKEISLGKIEARIKREMASDGTEATLFHIEIELGGDLTKRERILLFNSARNCEVNKLLSGDVSFEYKLFGG